MWISRKEKEDLDRRLEEVTKERDAWEAKYKCVTENQAVVDGKSGCICISLSMYNSLVKPLPELNSRCKSLEKEILKWKKYYADEVQKRLTLIEQMKG